MLLWALLGFILLTYIPLTWGVELPGQFWAKQVFQYTVLITVFYSNAYVIVPRLLLRNRMAQYIMTTVALVIVIMLISSVVDMMLDLPERIYKIIGSSRKDEGGYDIFMLFSLLLVLGISSSITVIQHWQLDTRRRQELQQQQITSELSFLKAQIHPHFLFNTLNNIYSLTFVDIESSRKSLHKLSWMMRYMLYDARNDGSPLHNEFRLLEDYVSLMRLRLNKHTEVMLNIAPAVHEWSIAPMLLLPFVENAFKHGVSASQPSKIDIKIQLEGTRLILDVKNPVFLQKSEMAESGGIGLANTERRLKLLYKNRHVLTYGPTPDHHYTVHLEITLS